MSQLILVPRIEVCGPLSIPGYLTLVDDQSPGAVDFANLEFISPVRRGERAVPKEYLRQRADDLGAIGNIGLFILIKDQPALIPDDVRKLYVILPFTRFRSKGGFVYYPHMHYEAGELKLGFDWIGGYGSSVRLIRIRR
jgi:hypothetical protein